MLHVAPANAHDRDEVVTLAAAVQDATGETFSLAHVDQGYSGDAARQAAANCWPSSVALCCCPPGGD